MFTNFTWGMASLKRRQLQASILLEALVAMAVFAAIASLLLGQISRSRKEQRVLLQQEEVLRVAKMALQTGQEELHTNGITVRQLKTDKQLLVYHEGEVVIRVQKP
ncbi:Type II secretory pathway pseudopilin [Streptococcus sanguinis]|uniref:Type II secretory pathway pseudopilin n=2 Tax=Streptococcus TaxID=1301 RepID=A0AB74DNS1_STRSA|nr:Type II secretory pathway pseudopilin [Streptococcus sanguinis]RSI43436.1 Type II secretory pathway pseudopilin [Streptococcus sanguinis]RSI51135.1 Type II secretory pathway pseudopilin [Streptococcus sanguinis]RSI64310.1 Type II secretory pathway pseudopilin [Streptococcus sanguinis]